MSPFGLSTKLRPVKSLEIGKASLSALKHDSDDSQYCVISERQTKIKYIC